MCALQLVLCLKHVFTCSAKGMKDLPLNWTVSIILFFKLAIQRWIESDEMSQTEGPWWEPFPECMNLFLSPWTITSHFCCPFQGPWPLNGYHLWLWWNGQSKVSQALCHICFNPACQSSMLQLFIMFLLISIMKGLIMLMRRPNGLVLSVGDTAVGLQGKSCAKCVT